MLTCRAQKPKSQGNRTLTLVARNLQSSRKPTLFQPAVCFQYVVSKHVTIASRSLTNTTTRPRCPRWNGRRGGIFDYRAQLGLPQGIPRGFRVLRRGFCVFDRRNVSHKQPGGRKREGLDAVGSAECLPCCGRFVPGILCCLMLGFDAMSNVNAHEVGDVLAVPEVHVQSVCQKTCSSFVQRRWFRRKFLPWPLMCLLEGRFITILALTSAWYQGSSPTDGDFLHAIHCREREGGERRRETAREI